MKENRKINLTNQSFSYFMNTKNWWLPLTFIFVISLAGVALIGYQTYYDAPPEVSFLSENNDVIIEKASINIGQEVFHKYALMEYGSFFGDGAQRGPDFTAEALHLVSEYMTEFNINKFKEKNGREPSINEIKVLQEDTKQDLKINKYNTKEDYILLSESQVYAYYKLESYYLDLFIHKNVDKQFPKVGYISNKNEIKDLSSFFFWGAWVCVVERPGSDYSYTHNWPFDPTAGNTPSSPVILWSVLGMLGFVLGCGIVLYFIGQYNQLPNKFFKASNKELLTSDKVALFKPTKTQVATFKFFAVAAILFTLQVSSGIITINDFVDFFSYVGINIAGEIPVTISRSWHIMLSLFWISTCWIASSILFYLYYLKKKLMVN